MMNAMAGRYSSPWLPTDSIWSVSMVSVLYGQGTLWSVYSLVLCVCYEVVWRQTEIFALASIWTPTPMI